MCVDADEKRMFFSGLSRQEGDKERIGISRRPSESVFRRACAYGEIGCAEYLFLRIGGCVECGYGCFSGVFRDDGDAILFGQREKSSAVFKRGEGCLRIVCSREENIPEFGSNATFDGYFFGPGGESGC